MNDVILGSIAYINTQEVDNLLESIEGGLIEELKESKKETKAKKGEGNVGIPGTSIGIKGNLEAIQEEAREAVKKTTPVSKLTSLRNILNSNEWATYINVIDDKVRPSLRPGRLVEVEGELKLSMLGKAIDRFSRLVSMAKRYGQQLGMDTSQVESYEAFLPYLEYLVERGVPAYISPERMTPTKAGFDFACILDPKYLRAQVDELEGQVTILARVKRLIQPGDVVYLYELFPGVDMLPKEKMQAFLDNLTKSPNGLSLTKRDIQVSYPTIVVKPIAIYA